MNKVAKNASWIIVCRIVQSILNVVVGMVTARYLGPSNYGIITYSASIVAFIVPVVQLGLNAVLVQEFIDNPEKTGQTIGTATMLSTASSFLGVIGVWLFTSIVNRGEVDTIIVSIIYSISMFFQMTEMIQYWYQAKLLSKYVSIISLLSRFIVSVYKIYIVIAGKNIYWFAVVNSLDYLLISVGLFIIYFQKGGSKLEISTSRAKEMLSKSKHFILSGMMVSVFAHTDKIMLKIMLGDAVSGYYSVAISCATMSSFVFAAIIDSFRPVIFENKKYDEYAYKKNIIRMYSIIIYMALIQSVVLTIFANPIVNLLYGSEYLPAKDILKIITWYSTFSYLGAARTIWFLAEGKQKFVWVTNLIGAIANVVGNLVLIPLFGAAGAAIASVCTQILTNFVINFFIDSIRENGMWMISAFNPKIIYDILKYIRPGKKSEAIVMVERGSK